MPNLTTTLAVLVVVISMVCIVGAYVMRKLYEKLQDLQIREYSYYMESETRRLAEARYDLLIKWIEVECQSAPKELGALRIRILELNDPRIRLVEDISARKRTR